MLNLKVDIVVVRNDAKNHRQGESMYFVPYYAQMPMKGRARLNLQSLKRSRIVRNPTTRRSRLRVDSQAVYSV